MNLVVRQQTHLVVEDDRIAPRALEAALKHRGWTQVDKGMWQPNGFAIGGEQVMGEFTWIEALTLIMFQRDLQLHGIVRIEKSEVTSENN